MWLYGKKRKSYFLQAQIFLLKKALLFVFNEDYNISVMDFHSQPLVEHTLGKKKELLCKMNEIEYYKLYHSGSAPARIYGTPEMHKFSSSDSFPKICQIVSCIGNFNYNLVYFLCDLLLPLVPNYYSCKDCFLFPTM